MSRFKEYYVDENYFNVLEDSEMYKKVKNKKELSQTFTNFINKKGEILIKKLSNGENEGMEALNYFKSVENKEIIKKTSDKIFNSFYQVLEKICLENGEDLPKHLKQRALDIENNNSITDNIKDISNLGVTAFLAKFLTKEDNKKFNDLENITEDQMNDIDKLLVMNHERILANLNLDQLNYYVDLCNSLEIEITRDMQHVLECYKMDPEGTLKIHEMLLEFNERSNYLKLKNLEMNEDNNNPFGGREVVLNYGNNE
jgi:hypothetical protein